VTNADARNYSLSRFDFDEFDRTLVDAPCSCEGTIRKNPDALDNWSEGHISSVAGIQKGIIRRAIQATREGDRRLLDVYLRARGERSRRPARTRDRVLSGRRLRPRPEHSPGLTEWDGEAFDSSLANAARIYPHQNDTGGFFVAKLEVTAE